MPTMLTEVEQVGIPATRVRRALAVSITARVDADEGLVLRVGATADARPLRLYLYIDAELAEAWTLAPEVVEFRAGLLAPGRHTVTARAIDGLGRWQAASTIVALGSLVLR